MSSRIYSSAEVNICGWAFEKSVCNERFDALICLLFWFRGEFTNIPIELRLDNVTAEDAQVLFTWALCLSFRSFSSARQKWLPNKHGILSWILPLLQYKRCSAVVSCVGNPIFGAQCWSGYCCRQLSLDRMKVSLKAEMEQMRLIQVGNGWFRVIRIIRVIQVVSRYNGGTL